MNLAANNTELRALVIAQASLCSTVQRHLSNSVWIVGGSVKYNDALSPRFTGELDLDCYVVFSRSKFSWHLAHDLKEVLINACREHGWHIEERRFGYRVRLQDVPRLTLDIGVIRESGTVAELVDATGYPIGPTDVLNAKPKLTRLLAQPTVRYA